MSKLSNNTINHKILSDAVSKFELDTGAELVVVVSKRSSFYWGLQFYTLFISMMCSFMLLYFFPENYFFIVLFPIFISVFARSKPFLRLFGAFMFTKKCEREARLQFLAKSVNQTKGKTGVLLYISQLEKRAHIIVDSGVAEKAEQKMFDDFISACTSKIKTMSSLEEALSESIIFLNESFKANNIVFDYTNENELPDQVEIEE